MQALIWDGNVTKDPQPAFLFTIARSRWRLYVVHFLHVLAVLGCWLNSLPVALRLTAVLLVLTSWVFQYSASLVASVFLRYSTAGDWSLSYDGVTFVAINIKPETVLGSLLTVLHFKTDKQSGSLLVFKDAVAANQYRKLLVQLKISGQSRE